MKFNGKTLYRNCNSYLTTNLFGVARRTFDEQLIDKIPLIPNKSAGTCYETYYAYHQIGSEWIDIPDINDVRVHTPIHNELTLTTSSTNQLENEDIRNMATGAKLVRIDDTFNVNLKIWGSSRYYSAIAYVSSKSTGRIIDYAKKITFECSVCGFSDDITAECKTASPGKPRGEYNHPCKADINKVTDLQAYPITATVWVENHGKGGPDLTGANITNEPDDYYILKRTVRVFIIGKIYDLQVRAVDDIGWKLKLAEDLSNLPTGEQNDNKLTQYKEGLKLGYRAYLDLKTLGTASTSIQIKPDIYYIKPNGTVAGKIKIDTADDYTGDFYNLWFKTKDGRYKKLEPDDYVINMIMNNTKGEEYNSLFKEETLKMFNKDKTIDYNKTLQIGGLLGIDLSKQNSTVTKYLYKDGVTFNYTTPEENSRRWYGEVYLPSSTVVAAYSATEKDVSNGKKLYDTGYLLVTFEPIETTKSGGAKYLKYNEIRDFNWKLPTDPEFKGDTTTSVLIEEKGNKGLSAPLKLPNGKSIANLPSDFYENDAPIVIYDVSLKANDDMEISGTH